MKPSEVFVISFQSDKGTDSVCCQARVQVQVLSQISNKRPGELIAKGPKDQDISKNSQSNTSLTLKKVHLVAD